jgi:hypothetical protein
MGHVLKQAVGVPFMRTEKQLKMLFRLDFRRMIGNKVLLSCTVTCGTSFPQSCPARMMLHPE